MWFARSDLETRFMRSRQHDSALRRMHAPTSRPGSAVLTDPSGCSLHAERYTARADRAPRQRLCGLALISSCRSVAVASPIRTCSLPDDLPRISEVALFALLVSNTASLTWSPDVERLARLVRELVGVGRGTTDPIDRPRHKSASGLILASACAVPPPEPLRTFRCQERTTIGQITS